MRKASDGNVASTNCISGYKRDKTLHSRYIYKIIQGEIELRRIRYFSPLTKLKLDEKKPE